MSAGQTCASPVSVTPHAGVWIEIRKTCGYFQKVKVTPHTGVWIEIFYVATLSSSYMVTPHAGMWIEIYTHTDYDNQ